VITSAFFSSIFLVCSLLNVPSKEDAIRVLVLPPYDKIANLGVSPDSQKWLEEALSKHERFSVIPFPLKKLQGVSYQMIYDKRYCKPIVDKVACDVIVMTQLITENEFKPGTHPWSYSIKIYDVASGKQFESIAGKNLLAESIKQDLLGKISQLVADIKSAKTK
jgi:hypothetical protein